MGGTRPLVGIMRVLASQPAAPEMIFDGASPERAERIHKPMRADGLVSPSGLSALRDTFSLSIAKASTVDRRYGLVGADALAPGSSDWAGSRRVASVLARSSWPIVAAAITAMFAMVSSRRGSS